LPLLPEAEMVKTPKFVIDRANAYLGAVAIFFLIGLVCWMAVGLVVEKNVLLRVVYIFGLIMFTLMFIKPKCKEFNIFKGMIHLKY
jgi:hypothetical protein